MARVKQFNLPDPGEGLTEAEIVTWKVKVGDTVKVNDIVVEIETAKSLVELPVPYAGTVTDLLVPEGETVEVGTPIIAVDTGVDDGLPEAPAPAGAARRRGRGDRGRQDRRRRARWPGRRARRLRPPDDRGQAPPPQGRRPGAVPAPAPRWRPVPAAGAPAAPPHPQRHPPPRRSPDGPVAVARWPSRRCASTPRTSASTSPTWPARVRAASSAAPTSTATSSSPRARPVRPARRRPRLAALVRPGERETRIPVKGVRKMTAQAMVASAFTAPHVTEFITVDVTRTMKLVERLRTDREFRDVKVSPLLVVAKALLISARRNPGINATWDEAAQEIVVKNYVNLGIAAATPRGLMVPNIKDADAMSLRQLADAMAALVATAREGRTQPAEMAGGTITITNVGVFGVDNGTPILNPGEAAILCFGAVRQMPWVVKGKVKPRWVTSLSLSFDHRHGRRRARLAVPGRPGRRARGPEPGPGLGLSLPSPAPLAAPRP